MRKGCGDCAQTAGGEAARQPDADKAQGEAEALPEQTAKRAAIFIGPEFGTVPRRDLVAAAREAAEAAEAGFDVLIACAFNYTTRMPRSWTSWGASRCLRRALTPICIWRIISKIPARAICS